MPTPTMSTSEAAEALDVSSSTVLRLIDAGDLRARRKTPCGPWLVYLESLNALIDDLEPDDDRVDDERDDDEDEDFNDEIFDD